MEIWQVAILGLIQGLTEFIPISSSGHLVLARSLFGWYSPGVTLDAILHMGTLLAVIVYFWKTWIAILKAFFVWFGNLFIEKKNLFNTADLKLFWFVVIATIPTAIVAYLMSDYLEERWNDILWLSLHRFAVGR